MAAIRGRRQALENDRRLQQFIIRSVTPTGKKLGSGAYGSVEEIEIDGTIYAGKIIHEILLEQGNAGVQHLVEKYVEECQLMSHLRHPHIVQFIGLCFLQDSSLPVLIMELLHTSLDDLLENTPDIPLALKRSMLADVSRGLVYLHNRNPPIIHRDLSAKNVLLNSSMVAKISDMGNSQIVAIQPDQLARTLSRVPGTMVYMPPEAFEKGTRYGPSLDSFSFGHLALYTLTQVFPGDLLAYTYQNPFNRKQVLGRSEIERRRDYFDQLHKQLGEQHPMVQLTKQCLDNDPEVRPPANVILQRLEGVSVRDPYLQLTKVEMMKLLKQKDDQVDQLQLDNSAKSRLVTDQQDQIRAFQEAVDRKDAQLQQKDTILGQKDAQLQQKDALLGQKDAQLQQKDALLGQKDAQFQQKDEELALLRSQQTANSLTKLKDDVPMTEQTRRETEVAKVKSPTGSKHDSSALFEASKRGDVGTLRQLLDAGVSTELQAEDGTTALMYACLNGHEEAVKILLSAKANVDCQDNEGYTALHCASENGHWDTVRVVLDAGANTELQTETGVTALLKACDRGHKDITVLLLSAKANIDHQTKEGITALYVACQNGHRETVQVLLDSGANTELQFKTGHTALIIACQERHKDITVLLLSAKANIDHQTKDGATALFVASQNGHRETVQVLLDSGANTELQHQSSGHTALIIACEKGHKDITVLLLSAKANIDHQNKTGDTALITACDRGHKDITVLLLSAKANIDHQTKNGDTALYIACQNGLRETVQVLLDSGANTELQRQTGATALTIACQEGHKDITVLLLSAKTNIDHQNKEGLTALHLACQNGHTSVVSVLLEHGADLHLTTKKSGKTPLMLASLNGRVNVVHQLIKAKADVNQLSRAGSTALDMARQKGHTEVCQVLLARGH